MPRVPSVIEFPSNIPVGIVPPANSTEPRNVLILLHGLGDTEVPFTAFAQQLNLRYTVSIALRGPKTLPGIDGYRWSDDLLYDPDSTDVNMDSGFYAAITNIEQVVNVLTQECGFGKKNIFFFGNGQGAMAGFGYAAGAERAARRANHGKSRSRTWKFGGIIAIGGGLPSEQLSWCPQSMPELLETPVLLCGTKNRTRVTSSVVHALRDRYTNLEYVQWRGREGDGMPQNREEMFPIMSFLAQNLI